MHLQKTYKFTNPAPDPDPALVSANRLPTSSLKLNLNTTNIVKDLFFEIKIKHNLILSFQYKFRFDSLLPKQKLIIQGPHLTGA
jgi:hypothetical protein